MLIKLGILLVGFFYAGLLPFAVIKTLQHLDFDLEEYTLSFLSNQILYDQKYVRGYKRLLFTMAILNYLFFWLLSKFYDLGENELYMQQVTYSFAVLTLLAFIPHNGFPYSLKHPSRSLERLLHNILGIVVFIAISTLIIIFQIAILHDIFFFGVSGLVFIVFVILITAISLVKNGINGITQLLFINGVSIWTIYVTIITFIL
jgi:hypothetical protein